MKIDKTFNAKNFSRYYQHNKNLPHSIKLVVDDIILDVSKCVLSSWSQEFQNKADEDSEIFLTEFLGNKEQVRECVEMMHGQEVAVDFNNITVIIKFAQMFKIPEMIDASMVWVQQNISVNTFVNVVTIYCFLDKIGYKSDHLMEIIRIFIVENRENCVFGMLKRHFGDELKVLIDILIYDGPLVNNCIGIFNSKTREENEYEYLMEKLENVSVDNEEILIENRRELDNLIDKVTEEVENPKLLKQFLKFSRRLAADKGASCSGISSPGNAWRTLSKEEILTLRTNFEIKEYRYAVICLEWIEVNKPPEGDVFDLCTSMQHENLSDIFVDYIRYILHNELNYKNISNTAPRLPAYEYDDQRWNISKQQLLDCLVNAQTVQLTSKICYLSSCTQTKHTINIRLESTSTETISVLTVPGVTPNQHTHHSNGYVFWYLIGYNYTPEQGNSRYMLASLYTKSSREIIALVQQKNRFNIRCLVRKV